MNRKRLVPKAWTNLRHCCGSAPEVTYSPNEDATTIVCESCGLYSSNCYDDEAVENWNGQNLLGSIGDDERWEAECLKAEEAARKDREVLLRG